MCDTAVVSLNNPTASHKSHVRKKYHTHDIFCINKEENIQIYSVNNNYIYNISARSTHPFQT